MATPEPYNDNFLSDVKPPPEFFDKFRLGNFPTQYPSILTSVSADVVEVGWIFAACILAFSLLLVVPGIRRWNGILSAVIRITVGVGFWVFIILCNFGQAWEVSDVKQVRTAYKALLPGEINASIGIHIGLRSVNITLLGEPRIQSFEHGLMNETIDYNERFSWDNRGWTIGRAGFGPYAGRFNQEFRAAQRRGLPYPILWIAEYFTVDGEGLRWGRYYLQSGYFTHIFLWTAWALWMVTVFLFNMVPRFGGYFSTLTGLTLIVGNIIYGNVRNPNQLAIPFYFEGCANESDPSDHRHCLMQFHYAWCFWLCLATGICCVLIGVAVVVMDIYRPEALADFFNVDIVEDLEEFISDDTDTQTSSRRFSSAVVISDGRPSEANKEGAAANGASADGQFVPQQSVYRHGFRKRTVYGRIQKSQKAKSGSRLVTRENPQTAENIPQAYSYNEMTAADEKAREEDYDSFAGPSYENVNV